MKQPTIRRRLLSASPHGWAIGTPSLKQRLYALRGVLSPEDFPRELERLHPANLLSDIDLAVQRIQKAIETDESILISGDYDCDGATATTVAMRGLTMLGAKALRFAIPDRFKHGYGLTPALIDTMVPKPDLIITVDSGIASVEGVAYAGSLGIDVVVTDHHLPGETLPAAVAMVNPNKRGDRFPSGALAGVGVMYYTLVALRAYQKTLSYRAPHPEGLEELLDIVAMGTVADLVPLDANNRILVHLGLERIRQGFAHPGIDALIRKARKDPAKLTARDIGFSVAPRLNAAGRLKDMTIGVRCLLCDDPEAAAIYVDQLDAINQHRRELQTQMIEEANALVGAMPVPEAHASLTVYRPGWHAGVIGLVASRLKESFHRPAFAFARDEENPEYLKGSGRSIPGFHLRDALQAIDAAHPGLIAKYGGHAMAAGLTLAKSALKAFTKALEAYAAEALTPDLLENVFLSDGSLHPAEMTLEMAKAIETWGPWGQAFPEPQFDNEFDVVDCRVVGEKHLKLQVAVPTGEVFDVIGFGLYDGQHIPHRVRIGYTLGVNSWQGVETLQLVARCILPV